MHANRVCRYVLIIACRLGPFSLIKLPSDERRQALNTFQHFTAVYRDCILSSAKRL